MQYNFHFVNLVFKWGNINCSPFTLRYAHIFIALLNESNERKASRLICVVIFFSSLSVVRSHLPWKKIKKKNVKFINSRKSQQFTENQNFEMNFTLFVAIYVHAFGYDNQSNNFISNYDHVWIKINWTLPVCISNEKISVIWNRKKKNFYDA